MYKELIDCKNIVRVKIDRIAQYHYGEGNTMTPLPHKYKVSATVEYTRHEGEPYSYTARKSFSNTANCPFQASVDLYNKLIQKGIINATL